MCVFVRGLHVRARNIEGSNNYGPSVLRTITARYARMCSVECTLHSPKCAYQSRPNWMWWRLQRWESSGVRLRRRNYGPSESRTIAVQNTPGCLGRVHPALDHDHSSIPAVHGLVASLRWQAKIHFLTQHGKPSGGSLRASLRIYTAHC